MTELFEDTPREHYNKAPLVQVICQLRFPKLLTIEIGPPANFQEAIRDRFPLVKVTPAFTVNIPPEIANIFAQQGAGAGTNYEFSTENQAYTVGLNSEALSLTTTQYSDWETFIAMFVHAFEALNSIYRPSFFTRIGLRYQDAISRADLELSEVPWSQLLRKELLGEIALPQFEKKLEGVAKREVQFRNEDDTGLIMLRHGLAQMVEKQEVAYIIDLDFFTNDTKTEVGNAINTLTSYNKMAGRVFRWCITEKLRLALEPVAMESKPA